MFSARQVAKLARWMSWAVLLAGATITGAGAWFILDGERSLWYLVLAATWAVIIVFLTALMLLGVTFIKVVADYISRATWTDEDEDRAEELALPALSLGLKPRRGKSEG